MCFKGMLHSDLKTYSTDPHDTERSSEALSRESQCLFRNDIWLQQGLKHWNSAIFFRFGSFSPTALGLLSEHHEREVWLLHDSYALMTFHVIYTSFGKLHCVLTMQKSRAITLSVLNDCLNSSHKYFSDNALYFHACPFGLSECV